MGVIGVVRVHVFQKVVDYFVCGFRIFCISSIRLGSIQIYMKEITNKSRKESLSGISFISQCGNSSKNQYLLYILFFIIDVMKKIL